MASTINASTSSGIVQTADTSGVLQLQTNGAATVTVDTSGNVLVGKTTSTGVGTQNIEIKNSSSATVLVTGGSYDWSLLVSASANALRFYSSSTELMRLDSSGNLGLGTTTPDIFSRGYGKIVGISEVSRRCC